MPLGKSTTQQVMLARSWSVLRHLGFPTQPHTYPYPHLPPVVSDSVQDLEDGGMVESDAEDSDYQPESEEETEGEISLDAEDEYVDPNDLIA